MNSKGFHEIKTSGRVSLFVSLILLGIGLILPGLAAGQSEDSFAGNPPGSMGDFNPGILDVASSNPWRPGGRDGRIDLADLAVFSYYWMMQDTVSPFPNPAQWGKRGGIVDGRPSPGVTPTEIIMTAKSATDNWGWEVAYQFECVKINNQSVSIKSPWLYYPAGVDPTWVATGLQTGTTYTYVCRVAEIRVPGTLEEAGYLIDPTGTVIRSEHIKREYPVNSNWTVDSVPASATTGHETDAPTPIAWEVQPYQNAANSVSMTAVAASDEHSPVSYIFLRYHDANDQIAEMTYNAHQARTWIDTNVQVGETWTYSFIAVDNIGNFSAEAPRTTVTIVGIDINPPLPDPLTWDTTPVRMNINGQWYDYMQATVAVDPEGTVVQYQVREMYNGNMSPWQADTDVPFVPVGLDPSGYTGLSFWIPAGGEFAMRQYQCRARDTSPRLNTTAWSTPPLQPQQ